MIKDRKHNNLLRIFGVEMIEIRNQQPETNVEKKVRYFQLYKENVPNHCTGALKPTPNDNNAWLCSQFNVCVWLYACAVNVVKRHKIFTIANCRVDWFLPQIKKDGFIDLLQWKWSHPFSFENKGECRRKSCIKCVRTTNTVSVQPKPARHRLHLLYYITLND